jgi:hypothetical protein
MKKILVIAFVIYFIGFIYLILPSPEYPDLTGATRSDQEGDTWQHPDQKGFYTNMDRASVLRDIQSQFVIKLGGFTLPSFRLNYAPEEVAVFVREQIESYYLEEIIYPFRESLFVNGWEPKKSPIYAKLIPKDVPQIIFHGVVYDSKVTLKPTSSPVWARILIWTLSFPVTYITYLTLKKSLAKNV